MMSSDRESARRRFHRPQSRLVNLPIRIWGGCWFLILLLLSLRYGPSGAVEGSSAFVATLIAAAAWGAYGFIVLRGLADRMIGACEGRPPIA